MEHNHPEPIDWAHLVRTYRGRPDSESARILIEALTPRLRARAAQLPAAPPMIDADDIWQQLCLEVLAVARNLRLPSDPRLIPIRLVSRAGRLVARSVFRELSLDPDGLDDDLEMPEEAAINELPPRLALAVLIDTDDIELVHQRHVLGMDYFRLAKEQGVSPEAVRKRVSRARRRLRDAIPGRAQFNPRTTNARLTQV